MESHVHRVEVQGNNHNLTYYLSSDDHMGGRDFEETSWRSWMNEAKERNAIVWKFGDVIGAIAPGDPRYTARCLEDSLNTDYYADAVVEYVASMYRPYVNILGGLGWGNHEVTWMKHHKSDLTERVITNLNASRDPGLPPILHLRYCGAIITRIIRRYGDKAKYSSYTIAYHHGFSSNAPVTKGVIAAQRFKDNFEGADLLCMGHIHKTWSMVDERFHVDGHDQIRAKEIRLVCTGSHQQSYTEAGEKNLQWAEQKGFPPAHYGGAFLLLKYHRDKGITARVEQ